MRHLVLLLASLLLLPASGCTQCNCLEMPRPDGPLLDLASEQGAVEAFAGGTFTGTVSDRGGDEREGVHFEPCAIAGEAYTLTLAVGEPSCGILHDIDEDGDTGVSADCADAQIANFPLTGDLVAGEESGAVTGNVQLQSWQQGLVVDLGLEIVSSAFEAESVDLMGPADALDEPLFETLTWSRRLSEEDDAVTVWEICDLTRGG